MYIDMNCIHSQHTLMTFLTTFYQDTLSHTTSLVLPVFRKRHYCIFAGTKTTVTLKLVEKWLHSQF